MSFKYKHFSKYPYTAYSFMIKIIPSGLNILSKKTEADLGLLPHPRWSAL